MPPRRERATSTALTIELRHRRLDPLAKGDLRGFGGAGQRRLGRGALVGIERREHVLDEIADLAKRIRRRDTDAQAWKVLADRGHDRAHAVVRAGAALLAEADLAERKVDLIENDEQIRRLDAVTVEELPDRAPGIVHERLRSRDRDADAVDRALGDARVGRLHGELGARALCQSRGDLKADVVPGTGVALAGITEPDDDAVDTRRGLVAPAEKLPESRHSRSQTPKGP